MTIKLAVVGDPIAHSLSPLLHNYCYRELGLDISYQALRVSKGSLAEQIKANGLAGVSVTMPLKEEAFELAVIHDRYSTLSSASNTLMVEPTGWSAHNTDVFGVKSALRGITSASSISIIGSGATARSALIAAGEQYFGAKIRVWGRTLKNVESLVSFGQHLGFTCQAEGNLQDLVLESDLVISTVPGGSLDDFWANLAGSKPRGVLLDTYYANWPSITAELFGVDRAISGIEMLKWQACAQVELFAKLADQAVSIDKEDLFQLMTEALEVH